jgi:hypothetical protein
MSGTKTEISTSRTIGWAAFLAASWTWCIGMFLPVLLIRDFGFLGWLVFAVPNVIGAAAMGWTIVSRDHSLTFVTNHRLAAQAFSYVTIGFHVFFVVWMFNRLLGPLGAAVGLGLLMCVLLPLFVTTVAVTAIAIGVLFLSVVMNVALAGGGGLALPSLATDPLGVMCLAVVCLLGFAFCPYLDLTFHRARQECAGPEESRVSFGVGFGVFFLAMIVFTMLYAAAFLSQVLWDRPVLRWALALHMMVQAMFTVGVHLTGLVGTCWVESQHKRRWWLTGATIFLPVVLALVVSRLDAQKVLYVSGMQWGEVAYRSFLAFYGLIAPAYVWICAVPSRGYRKPSPRDWMAVGAVCVTASPFFWIAFMHNRMEWVVFGVGIVLAGRFLTDGGKRDYLSEARQSMPLGSKDPLHPDR